MLDPSERAKGADVTETTDPLRPAADPTLASGQDEALRLGREARLKRARRMGRRKQLSYLVQYWAGLALIGLLRLLPIEVASNFGGWLGRKLLLRRLTTDAVKRTIRVPFPNASDDEVGAIITETADNAGRVVAEMAHLRSLAKPGNPRIRVSGEANVTLAIAGGRGVVVVLGHLANWEIPGIAARRLGLDGVFALMPPSNPYVFEWLARLRTSVGLSEQANAGEGVYRAFRKALRAGRVAGVLADQRLINGIRAPFFGRDVLTNAIPARLARTMGVAVLPVAVRRVNGRVAYFEVEAMTPLEFESTGDLDADEKRLSARMNAFFEGEILRAPGQWLWADPRWDEY